MYSIIYHSCVADQYPLAMEDQLLFSNSLWNASKLSKYFNNEISDETTSVFRKIWAEKCRERDITEAWIAIDGTNNNCKDQKTGIAEPAKAKSHKNVNMVSYMYAVDSRNGDPITFSIYRGERVDCKAVIEMIGWLTAYDIKVKGVIIDRGFATKEVFELFDQNGIDCVSMLKGDAKAHTVMLERYVNKIRMQYEYMFGRYRADGSTGTATEFTMDSNVLYGKDGYFVCHTENHRQISLMEACGVLPKDLGRIAEAENKRLTSIELDPCHCYPRHSERGKPSHREPGRTFLL